MGESDDSESQESRDLSTKVLSVNIVSASQCLYTSRDAPYIRRLDCRPGQPSVYTEGLYTHKVSMCLTGWLESVRNLSLACHI